MSEDEHKPIDELHLDACSTDQLNNVPYVDVLLVSCF